MHVTGHVGAQWRLIDSSDEELPADEITTHNETICCDNHTLTFLTRKGEEQLLESMIKIIQHLQNDKLHQCRQNNFGLHFVELYLFLLCWLLLWRTMQYNGDFFIIVDNLYKQATSM